ncbi:2Fe-2S iron-sulfur cluster-binding protein [Pseudonocardia sulfidoxydans]|nr:2Fe-2S iron-sulfur cluster-binding protein [Pseudonocardia sulfidoxydans]
MPEITFIGQDGASTTLAGSIGESIMRVATRHGIPGIEAECGGELACATCHIFVKTLGDADTEPPGEVEDLMLECTAVGRAFNSRLACQIYLTDEMGCVVVELPERQI